MEVHNIGHFTTFVNTLYHMQVLFFCRGEKLEILDAKVALMPLLMAERDRL